MNKEKKRILIPLILIGALLVYTWTIIISGEAYAGWRHYVGLVLYLGLVACFLKNIRITIILTGIYLLFATFNLLGMTVEITTRWITIGSVSTSPIQLMSLGILVIYFTFNMNSLFEIYLDYKESKNNKMG